MNSRTFNTVLKADSSAHIAKDLSIQRITASNLKPGISHLHHRFAVIIISFRFLAVRLPQDNVNVEDNIFVTYAWRRTAKPYSIAKTFIKTSKKMKVHNLSCQSQQMIPLPFLIFYLKNYTV